MKSTLLAAAFCLMSAPVFAQDTMALAKDYVSLPGVQNMVTEMFSPETMGNQIAAGMPAGMTLTDDKKEKIGVAMSDALSSLRPAMEEQMISSSASTFSAEELQALIDFYSSEYGASVMAKMSPFMADVMGHLQPQMQAIQMQVGPEIQKIMQE